MSQVVVVATFEIQPGKEDEAQDALRETIEGSHTEAGCLAYALHRDKNAGNVFVLVERWTSQVALENHRVQPHVRDFGRAVRDIVEGPAQIRVLSPLGLGDPAKGTL